MNRYLHTTVKCGLYTCLSCGKEECESNYSNNHLMVCRQMCFSCNFWTDWLYQKDDPNALVIRGQAYYVGREAKQHMHEFRGYGGRQFQIRKFKGDETPITTTNLWHNGVVPAHFRDRLPDTAEFVQDARLPSGSGYV